MKHVAVPQDMHRLIFSDRLKASDGRRLVNVMNRDPGRMRTALSAICCISSALKQVELANTMSAFVQSAIADSDRKSPSETRSGHPLRDENMFSYSSELMISMYEFIAATDIVNKS